MKEWIIENTSVKEEDYDKLINRNTLILDDEDIESYDREYNDHPMANIEKFTYDYPTYFRRKRFEISKLKQNKINTYFYHNIKFYVLGELLPNVAHKAFSEERLSSCFYFNAQICMLPQLTNSSLVTAMCDYVVSDEETSKYLHSFVLYRTNEGKEFILDGTTNIIMSKKKYFEMYKPQIISIIPRETLQKDLTLLEEFQKDDRIYRSEYLCFPDLIMKTVKTLAKKK